MRGSQDIVNAARRTTYSLSGEVRGTQIGSSTPYCFTWRKAVSVEFLDYVIALISTNKGRFQTNKTSPGRKFLKIENVAADGDRTLFDVKQQLAEHYGLGDYVVPPQLKDFIGCITEGGAVHPHKDPDLPGRRHVRINVLIRQTGGCIPLIDEIPISVEVGDAWLNLASKCLHATTAVEGRGYRSALSFGYQISPKRGDELYDEHLAWLLRSRPA